MRRSAIFAITVVVCACASWAQSLTEAQEHSALAIKLFRQAKFTEAEREYRLALDYARALGKAGLPEYSIFLANIAAVLQSQGRIKEARQALEECIFLEEHSLPQPRGVTLAHALNNLALINQTEAKLTEATRLLKRASSLTVDERTRAGTMHNLGAVYFEMGQRKKAEKLFDDAVEIYRRLNAMEELSPALTFVAKIAAEKGDTARAEVLLQEALELRKKISGPNHPNVALTLADIGEFQLSRKRYDAAIETFERALLMIEESLGPDHIFGVAILFQYAEAKQQLGHHDEALTVYERTIRILQRTYGPDHPRLAGIYRRAAFSSGKLKRKQEAKAYEQRANAIARNNVDWQRHTIDVSAFLPGK
jgi:tetratricopeptide (TPR) repeat protein